MARTGRAGGRRGDAGTRGSCRVGDRRIDRGLSGRGLRHDGVVDLLREVAGRLVAGLEVPQLRLLGRAALRIAELARAASSGCGSGSRTAARPATARRP